MNVIDKLTSLSGVVHVIDRTGIFTNGIRLPFESPIINDIDKAGTSPSGAFIFLIVHGKLYLVTICQSQLNLERIGDQETLFCDATFNNEESLFITLDNDSCFRLYELYPPIQICIKEAKMPLPPIYFKYYQLQNAFKVTDENNVNFLFKFPDLFDPDDPPELPYIKNMIQDEKENFIQLFEEEEEESIEKNSIDENLNGEDEQPENQYGPPSNIEELAMHTLQRGRYLQDFQNSLNERYENVLKETNDTRLKYFDICGKLRDSKKKLTNQIKQIYEILGSVDKYADLIFKDSDRFKDLQNNVESNLCDDDVINEEQEAEFKYLQFNERLKNIERKLRGEESND